MYNLVTDSFLNEHIFHHLSVGERCYKWVYIIHVNTAVY